MVSSYVSVIGFVDHVDVAEVLRSVACVLAIDLDHLIQAIASAIHSGSLAWITNSEVFLVLAAIHLDK